MSLKKTILFWGILLMGAQVHAQIDTINITSRQGGFWGLEDMTTAPIWGYAFYDTNPFATTLALPGPTIRVNKNDSIVLHMRNIGSQDHTIHLHGLDVDQANDGVPTTSFAVSAGDSTDYFFVAKYEGCYIYHCHVLTTLHLSMGMYGMIVVENDTVAKTMFDGGPTYTDVYEFMASDMDRSWNAAPMAVSDFHLFDADYFMLNGKAGTMLHDDTASVIEAHPGDSVMVRLFNIGYSNTRYTFPPDMNATIYMSDGRVLPAPVVSDTLNIHPGERYTVLFTPATYVFDSIEVVYEHLYNCDSIGTNYIYINEYTIPVGVDEPQYQAAFEVYPNPASGEITLINYATEPEILTIVDFSGKVVWSGQAYPGSNPIDVSELANGMYLVHSRSGSTKLVVQR